MSNWKEIALDDILDEVDEVAQQGEKQFASTPQDRCGTVIRDVPFCCVTTIPKGFTIPGALVMTETDSQPSKEEANGKVLATPSVAWHQCLNLRLERKNISVSACGDVNTPCGAIPACVTKVSGCIQFIASTPVNGDFIPNSGGGVLCPTPSSSNICCKGCVCVDECVRCQLIQNARLCPDDLGRVTVDVVEQKVCVKDCKPCYSCTPSGVSTVVKFSGKFRITYTPPMEA